MLRLIAFLLTFSAALNAWAKPYGTPGAAYDGVVGSLSGGGTMSAQLHFLDNVQLSFGNTRLDPDVWFSNNGTAFFLRSTNVGGATPGDIFSYTLGLNRIQFDSQIYAAYGAGSIIVSGGAGNYPAIGFAADDDGTGTGWYRASADTQAWSIDGIVKLWLDDTTLGVFGNDIKNIDDIYSTVLAADTLPRSTLILPQHPWAQSTTGANYIGSNLILGGSTGRKSVAITAAGSGGNTFVVTSNDSQVGGASNVATYTSDAGGWVCSTETNPVCVCNLYDIIIAAPNALWTIERTDATCSDAQLFVQPNPTTWLVDLAETGATFTLTERADGWARIHGSQLFVPGGTQANPGITFDRGGLNTGLYLQGSDVLVIRRAGSDKITLSSTILLNGNTRIPTANRLYASDGALNIGADYTGAGTGVTGATHFGEDSGNVSFWAQGKGYFEDTANIVTAKGALTTLDTTVESVTFAANPGDASKVTTGTAIPDGADLAYVTTRVVTLGTNCAGYSIGDGADVDLWGADIAVADTTTSTAADATATWSHPALANQEITITGTNGAGVAANCFDMVVAITAHFTQGTAATSD